MRKDLIEGVDFTIDHNSKKIIWSKEYLQKRGYCCTKLCQNCPYGFTQQEALIKKKVVKEIK